MTTKRATFTVYIHPVAHVEGCATKRAEEARGLLGFHAFTQCPACRVIPEGFEFWGENGHRQGECEATDLAWHVARLEARGDRVLAGTQLYYQGPWREEAGPEYGIAAARGEE